MASQKSSVSLIWKVLIDSGDGFHQIDTFYCLQPRVSLCHCTMIMTFGTHCNVTLCMGCVNTNSTEMLYITVTMHVG